ncbi:MAG: hypothetical protein LBC74_08925 [Planctomycetaceae bacterium]|nr:hypothetical protein [Planctomycetaceae bacterium]
MLQKINSAIILDLFSNLKIHQRNKKPTMKNRPLTPPRPPLTPPKEGNKKTPPREANYSPPSEGSGVVTYRLAKRSIFYQMIFPSVSANSLIISGV